MSSEVKWTILVGLLTSFLAATVTMLVTHALTPR